MVGKQQPLAPYSLIVIDAGEAREIRNTGDLSIPAGGTFLFQIVLGLVFGFLGILLAVPILAVTITLVRELYSYDVLGLRKNGSWSRSTATAGCALRRGKGVPCRCPSSLRGWRESRAAKLEM